MKISTQTESISNVYRLLSRLWIAEVDHDLLTQLQQPELRRALEALGAVVPQSTALDELAVEYCRWFIGPQGHLPLLQSVWDRGQLESDVTDSMRAFVNLFGYESKTNKPDHFGFQLAVMGHALLLPPTTATQEAMAAYFDRHLLWAKRLLQTAVNRDDSSFYQSLAQLTQRFLDSEAEERNLCEKSYSLAESSHRAPP